MYKKTRKEIFSALSVYVIYVELSKETRETPRVHCTFMQTQTIFFSFQVIYLRPDFIIIPGLYEYLLFFICALCHLLEILYFYDIFVVVVVLACVPKIQSMHECTEMRRHLWFASFQSYLVIDFEFNDNDDNGDKKFSWCVLVKE